MITNEHLEKICTHIVKNKTITTKALTELGLKSHDITKLIQDNILRRIKVGEYELISVDTLYNYAESIRDLNRANSYATNEFIYELDPHHKENNLRLLAFYVKKENFEKAFEILDSLYQYEDITKYNDLFLYMLSTMTKVPERYLDRVKTINKESLLEQYNNEPEEPLLIHKITDGKNLSVIYSFNQKGKENLNIYEDAIWQIASTAATKDKENNMLIIKYAKEERYYDIKRLLESKTTINKPTEKWILEVVNNILNIIKSKTLPVKNGENVSSLSDAIYSSDFELAYKLNQEYLERYNISDLNPLTILLRNINTMINNLKKEQNIEEEIPTEEEPKLDEEEKITLSSLIIELLNNNIEEFTILLRKYLKDNNLLEYEFLIMTLMKIDVINNDSSYIKTLTTLSQIDKSVFTFNISTYIEEFYNYISNKNLEISKLYLEIISKYYKESNMVIENLQKSLDKEINNLNINTEEVSSEETNTIEQKELDELKELVLRKITEAKSKGQTITLFEKQPLYQRKMIYDILKKVSDCDTFSIGEEPKTIALRILNSANGEIIRKEYFQDIFRSAKNRQYEEVIRLGNILLQDKSYNPLATHDPRPIFDIIGQAYLRLHKLEEAIIFLTIVTEINSIMKDKEERKDYTDLIERLKVEITSTERQESIELEYEETNNIEEKTLETKKELDISGIEEIAYIIKETNIPLEEAQTKYNLSEETVMMIRLIYVRDFYIEGMYSLGDARLKEVEKMKDKSEKVTAFIKELKVNKRFYKDRIEYQTKKRIK